MIIAAYAGVGKTTFCEQNSQNAIDVICMPFKYSNFYEVSKNIGEDEDIKAHKELKVRKDWCLYYYWVLKYLMSYCPEKYIVIPTIDIIMDFLDRDHVPYTIIVPNINLKDEYENRYKKRGNNQEFLDVFVGQWDVRITELNERNAEKIVLKSNQYLSDVLDCSKFFDYQDVYRNRQLLSFENSLKWENKRNDYVRKSLLEQQMQKAKSHYAESSLYNSMGRCFCTSMDVWNKLETRENEGEECSTTVISDYEEIIGLIEYALQEIDINYAEYSKDGELLRFTSDISFNSISAINKSSRCLDKHNYLNIWFNSAFSDWTGYDADHLSVSDIKNKYLKDYLSRIIGLLRKGNEYMPRVVTSKISDDELTTLVCLTYKKLLAYARSYYDGIEAKDRICGILYNKPICAEDIVDDYVIVESKQQLKILLEAIDDEYRFEPRFSLLEKTNEADGYKFKETVFKCEELRNIMALL